MGLISTDQLSYTPRNQLPDGFKSWITQHLDQGYDGYFITFMFNHIPGNQSSIIRIMKKDLELF